MGKYLGQSPGDIDNQLGAPWNPGEIARKAATYNSRILSAQSKLGRLKSHNKSEIRSKARQLSRRLRDKTKELQEFVQQQMKPPVPGSDNGNNRSSSGSRRSRNGSGSSGGRTRSGGSGSSESRDRKRTRLKPKLRELG